MFTPRNDVKDWCRPPLNQWSRDRSKYEGIGVYPLHIRSCSWIECNIDSNMGGCGSSICVHTHMNDTWWCWDSSFDRGKKKKRGGKLKRRGERAQNISNLMCTGGDCLGILFVCLCSWRWMRRTVDDVLEIGRIFWNCLVNSFGGNYWTVLYQLDPGKLYSPHHL